MVLQGVEVASPYQLSGHAFQNYLKVAHACCDSFMFRFYVEGL